MLNNELFAALLTVLVAGHPVPQQANCATWQQRATSVEQRQQRLQQVRNQKHIRQLERLAIASKGEAS